MEKILLWIWQFPQNIIGLLILYVNKLNGYCLKIKSKDGIEYYHVRHLNKCGVSLGNYIFLDYDNSLSDQLIHHELGHQKQSIQYGWLYLFIVGLPSIIGNIYGRIMKKDAKWYYNLPWEKQADKLGGVIRFWKQ